MIRFGLLAVGVFLFWFGDTDVDKVSASVYLAAFWVVTALRRAS